jgi:thiol-disulfide isomerase/thioredoxin
LTSTVVTRADVLRSLVAAASLVVWGTAIGPSGLRAQAGEGQVGLAIGTPAPEATVEDLDGNPVELLDLVDDGPVLIEFWASWCENCEALQPQLDEIQATYGERLKIIAVAVAVSQSLRRVKRHLEDHDPGYPYVWDGRGAAVRAYEAPTTSVVVILDQEGKVAYTGVGGQQDLIGAVERVLGER